MGITSRRFSEFPTVFKSPSLFISLGHADHHCGSPGDREESGKGNKERQAFPALRKGIGCKTHGGIATAGKY